MGNICYGLSVMELTRFRRYVYANASGALSIIANGPEIQWF